MNFKVYDRRAENGRFYIFDTEKAFKKYHTVVWSCDHELVLLGLDDITNTLVFKRKED